MPTSFHSEDFFCEMSHSQSHSPSQCINSTESHFDQHEINHYHLTFYFEVAVECVNSLAGLLVLLAVCLAGVNLGIVAINSVTGSDYRLFDHMHSNGKATVLRIRLMLGEQTALALALLVAADVLDTVMKPSHAFEMNDVIKMGFLTVLRTGVAYFLAREIKELEMGGGHSSHGSMDNLVESDNSYRQRSFSLSSKKCKRLLHRTDSVDSVRSSSKSRWTEGSGRSGIKLHRKDSDVTTNSNNSGHAEECESSLSSPEESGSDGKTDTMDGDDGQPGSDRSASSGPPFSESSPRLHGRSSRTSSKERSFNRHYNSFVDDISNNNSSSEKKKSLKEE